ncbi:MAG: TRAP transporter substrate-binding protein [Clostridiales Family XIII bacterium]|jgi:TRAP-type C4-dicarboxylate transport system substrate-binding protein|nr:TRAP transporter substrate-binding protein [Clostridiales Family XIII bacterium]
MKKRMEKNRALAMLSILFLLLAAVTGCGGGNNETSGNSGGTGGDATGSEDTESPGIENTGQHFDWVLGTSYNDPVARPNYNNFGDTVNWFCELVDEKTNGQVTVTPYYNSLLGTQPELFQQLRENEIQVFIGQPMSTVDSRFGFWSLPGLFSTYDEVAAKFTSPDSELYQLADSIMQEKNVSLIGNSVGVLRWYFNTKKEIQVPADMKGLTTRVYEDTICQTYFSGLCSAVIVPAADLLMSLQTGIIDGTDHTAAYAVSNLYESCKFAADINWQWTWGGAVVANNDALNSLPDDLRQAVTEAAQEVSERYNAAYPETEKNAAEELTNKGVNVYKLTNSDREAWEEYADSLTSAMRNAIGADFYDEALAIVEK